MNTDFAIGFVLGALDMLIGLITGYYIGKRSA